MSISTVVFDFGNVLGFFSYQRAAEQVARHAPAGVTLDQILTFLDDSDLEAAFESGLISSNEVLSRLRRRFNLQGSDEELTLAIGDMFTPNHEVCALIPHLHGRYRLMLLSNTNDIHFRHYCRQFAEVLDRFDSLVASHLVGVRKPDPRIYHHAREQAGCPASECLFIDDLPANIEAARACGWQGILYRRGDDLRRLLLQAGVALGHDPGIRR
jgi:putative hydrolase of the HAD superfamily